MLCSSVAKLTASCIKLKFINIQGSQEQVSRVTQEHMDSEGERLMASSNLHEEWPRARRMWPEEEPQTHLPPCLAPSGKRAKLSQTWRQNIIACCVGEQPVFIRAGDFPGGAGYSRLRWKGPLSFHRPTFLHLWPWLTWTLCFVELVETQLNCQQSGMPLSGWQTSSTQLFPVAFPLTLWLLLRGWSAQVTAWRMGSC